MKLFLLFFGLLVCVCSVYADECEEGPKQCVLPLMMSLQEDAVDCDVLEGTKECFVELADKCVEDEDERAEIDGYLDELTARINNACAKEEHYDYSAEEGNIEECLEEYVVPTAMKCNRQVLSSVTDEDFSGNDVKCEAILRIINCVTIKVGKICGNAVREPLYNGLILAMKHSEIGDDIAQSRRCASAIRDAQDETEYEEEDEEEYEEEYDHYADKRKKRVA